MISIPPTQESFSRSPEEHALIGLAAQIPASKPFPVLSIMPVNIKIPERIVDLQVRISAPISGSDLPVILLSHGHGPSNYLSSMKGYSPLADFYASQGFAVIQPTHLSSKSLSLSATTPGAPLFWKSRVEDMKHILDHLDEIEAALPSLQGRLAQQRVAVAGHSMGGHTAGMLLGARLTDEDGQTVDLSEPRIKAGVLLAPPGTGGSDLSQNAFENYKFFRKPSFNEMTTQALVVVGDQDASPHLTVRGADWHADSYHLSSGPKCLLTIAGGHHGLGGVSGYDVAETRDESPERLATVQRLTSAYLHSALDPLNDVWPRAREVFAGLNNLGEIVCK